MIRFIILAAICAPAPVIAQSENDYVEDDYEVNCVKPRNTSGCTAHGTKAYTAPTGYGIDPGSISIHMIPGWNASKRMDCAHETDDLRNISGTLSNGATINITAPTILRVTAHSESGSGPSQMGRTSWVKCKVKYRLIPLG